MWVMARGIGNSQKSFGKGSNGIKVEIEHIATDLSAAFIAFCPENCSGAVHVFDHFHVVKLMNEHLDDIRRKVYTIEKDINKRKFAQRYKISALRKWCGYI